jgi:hypothetical protein
MKNDDIDKILEEGLANIEKLTDKDWIDLCNEYTDTSHKCANIIPCSQCGKDFHPPTMPYYGDPTICPDCQSKNSGSIFKQPYSNCHCINCPNSPENGGSGVCHCTLGSPTIT